MYSVEEETVKSSMVRDVVAKNCNLAIITNE